MKLMRILSFIAIISFFWICWVAVGHDERAINRLVAAGLVKPGTQIELIYSTGYLREATHYFAMDSVQIKTKDEGGPVLEEIPPELVDEFVQFKSLPDKVQDWIRVWDISKARFRLGEGFGLLSQIVVISCNDKSVVILKIF